MDPRTSTSTERSSRRHLLVGSGFLAWGVVTLAQILKFVSSGRHLGSSAAVSFGALVLFAAAFWLATGRAKTSRGGRRWALFLQAAAAIVVTAATLKTSQLSLVLLVVSAAQAPALWSTRGALLWVLGQNLAVFPFVLAGQAFIDALLMATSYLAFQAFAGVMAYLTEREAEARALYAGALAELAGTQAELGEVHRSAERLRIARELHDQVGHQLTALSLQLEVAAHANAAGVSAAVALARTLAKETLADLRRVVSALRETPEFDLLAALHNLASRIRRPRIRLTLPESIDVKDPAIAWALFRCAQEGVTNAARHAQAEHVELSLEAGSSYELRVCDDGRGAALIAFGNGLVGLRERLRVLSGTLKAESTPGSGFTLSARIPRPNPGAEAP